MTDLFSGFSNLFADFNAMFFTFAGAFVGIIFGALPGLTASAAIAMLLPLTFHLGPLPALAFLYVIGKSGRYGGSISAILFNTPGTAASAATMLDGYPMTKRGEAGKALKTATFASVFGDYVGEFILIFCGVFIASFTKSFGPAEYFSIYVMAFVVIGSVVGESVIKGLISVLFGASCAMVGLDIITNEPRLTMGLYRLEDGLALVPLLIGVFVISEIIAQAHLLMTPSTDSQGEISTHPPGVNSVSWPEFKRCIPVMIRSSMVGSFIGILPGLGSSVACFVAYGEEKRRSKDPSKWGTGIVEGVAAPETANNAVSGPSMIPLLTLGIPGSTIAAILIGVFVIHGIQVGPSIYEDEYNRRLIYSLFAAGLLGIAVYGVIGYFFGQWIGRLIGKIPMRILYPFIFVTAITASYSSRASIFDVGIAILFGFIGYAMRRTGFSAAAFVIAFVLSKNMEESFRQALLISDNGMMIFISDPVPAAFLAIGLLMMTLRVISSARR